MMNNPNTHRSCENCIGEHFANCLKGKCIHGIPELIRPGEAGELFESGNGSDVKEKIQTLWTDADRLNEYTENCQNQGFDSIEQYCERLMEIYGSDGNSGV